MGGNHRLEHAHTFLHWRRQASLSLRLVVKKWVLCRCECLFARLESLENQFAVKKTQIFDVRLVVRTVSVKHGMSPASGVGRGFVP